MRFCNLEIERLQERKATYARVLERLERYVLGVIVKLGRDPKKKWRRLEGHVFTFKTRNCPASADITDESAVPLDIGRPRSSCRRSSGRS